VNEVYDDMGPVGEDELWDSYTGPLHDYLVQSFQLTYVDDNSKSTVTLRHVLIGRL